MPKNNFFFRRNYYSKKKKEKDGTEPLKAFTVVPLWCGKHPFYHAKQGSLCALHDTHPATINANRFVEGTLRGGIQYVVDCCCYVVFMSFFYCCTSAIKIETSRKAHTENYRVGYRKNRDFIPYQESLTYNLLEPWPNLRRKQNWNKMKIV